MHLAGPILAFTDTPRNLIAPRTWHGRSGYHGRERTPRSDSNLQLLVSSHSLEIQDLEGTSGTLLTRIAMKNVLNQPKHSNQRNEAATSKAKGGFAKPSHQLPIG